VTELVPVLVLIVFVVIFGAGLIFLISLIGAKPKTDSVMKGQAYECGLEGQSTGHSRTSVRFYLTALLFILFDIEVIFMYPFAISYIDFIDAGYGVFILAEMGVFLALFIFGLFWVIKSKALNWE